jgi:hypothetical protein
MGQTNLGRHEITQAAERQQRTRELVAVTKFICRTTCNTFNIAGKRSETHSKRPPFFRKSCVQHNGPSTLKNGTDCTLSHTICGRTAWRGSGMRPAKGSRCGNQLGRVVAVELRGNAINASEMPEGSNSCVGRFIRNWASSDPLSGAVEDD